MLAGTLARVGLKEKACFEQAFSQLCIPATTYSPTQSPVQYHRR